MKLLISVMNIFIHYKRAANTENMYNIYKYKYMTFVRFHEVIANSTDV